MAAESDDLYNAVHFAVHRKPPAVVGAPSLNFCRAYRAPARQHVEKRADWESNVKAFTRQMFERLVLQRTNGTLSALTTAAEVEGGEPLDRRERLLNNISVNASVLEIESNIDRVKEKFLVVVIFGDPYYMRYSDIGAMPPQQLKLTSVPVEGSLYDINSVLLHDRIRRDYIAFPHRDYSVFSFESLVPAYQSTKFRFSADVKIWAELHTEYFVISAHHDLSRKRRRILDEAGAEKDAMIRSDRHLKFFVKRMDEYLFYTARGCHGPGSDTKSTSLTDVYWARARKEIFETVWSSLIKDAMLDSDSASVLGLKFADFRSLTLGVEARQKGSGPSDKTSESADIPGANGASTRLPELQSLALRCVRWRDGPAFKASSVPKARIPEKELAAITARVWQFLREPRDPGSNTRYLSKEIAASTFLDGQALYVSALGPPPISKQDVENKILRFILLTSSPDRWQTGRLVSRLHHMGMMRLAALFDINDIVQASFDIQAAGQTTDYLYSKIATAPADHQMASPDKRSTDRNAESKSPERFSPNDMKSLFTLLHNINKKFADGLSYRIERSRYYVRQYDDAKQYLREGRVEGYQQYTHFVARRVGFRFDFIHRVGVRYERLTQRIQLLNFQALSSELIGVDKTIERLQTAGEDILLLLIAPYYLGNILYHVVFHPILNISEPAVLFAADRLHRHFHTSHLGLHIGVMLQGALSSDTLAEWLGFFSGLLLSWFLWVRRGNADGTLAAAGKPRRFMHIFRHIFVPSND